MQEINVALGGNIHQKVYEVSGMNDHREDTSAPVDVQYADSHSCARIAGQLVCRADGPCGFPG